MRPTDAVLILTDWKEFANIDLAKLNRAVRFPIVIDGRNLYKPQTMADHGFTYVSVGRPANYLAQEGSRASLRSKSVRLPTYGGTRDLPDHYALC